MEVSKQFFCQSVEEKTKCIKLDGEYVWLDWLGEGEVGFTNNNTNNIVLVTT